MTMYDQLHLVAHLVNVGYVKAARAHKLYSKQGIRDSFMHRDD